MADITISTLYPDVRLIANNCPDATISYAIIRAMRDFCRDSWFYQKTILMNQVDSQSIYPLTLSTGDEIIAVDSVEMDSRPMYPLDSRDYSQSSGGISRGFQFEPPNILVIVPTPTTYVADGIKVRAVLSPAENTTVIPESIYRLHNTDISHGALSYILRMQNEAWSNPQLAQQMEILFREGIFEAKGKRIRGFQARNLTIKPRSFL